MADKKTSVSERIFDFAIPVVVLVAVLLIAVVVCSWVGAMLVSSIDREFNPMSKRCQIVDAQDNEAAREMGLLP